MGNRNPEVDAWFDSYDNPQRELVASVRAYILSLDPALGEAVKWKAPTFIYRGNIASFFPRSKKTVTLMFHQGASIDDPLGLLEGDGEVSRVARFADAADLEAKKPALAAVIRAWMVAKG
ncbi:DUF1801 domain-containing protein [Arthrobacter sp. A2-55]|uniref:DUF1801 domain-containing protein n=1 Tax=Arthrobacter sp. A2-55 TaxID=2897337 RepID=UPI0021CDCF7D|nr:DUF1801 domain-containing protein [Arthrobacter sp. A2-55]MCU6482729.1 DUF1801 domain-containing protein [Arthrobacter sp. A2-55]